MRREGQEGKNINIELVGSALLDLLVGGTRTYLISLMIIGSFFLFFLFCPSFPYFFGIFDVYLRKLYTRGRFSA